MPWLHEAMAQPVQQVEAAGLFPATEHLQIFSNLLDRLDAEAATDAATAAAAAATFSSSSSSSSSSWDDNNDDDNAWISPPPPPPSSLAKTRAKKNPRTAGDKRPLSETLAQFFSSASCAPGGAFFVCRHDDVARLANRLHDVTSPMALTDAFTFCMAPVKASDRLSFSMLRQFADAWAKGLPTALNVRFPPSAPQDVLELTDLCVKHNICDLYLWLAHRFPGNFVERELALRQKAHAIGLIQQGLREMEIDLDDIMGLRFGANRHGGGNGGSALRKRLAAMGEEGARANGRPRSGQQHRSQQHQQQGKGKGKNNGHGFDIWTGAGAAALRPFGLGSGGGGGRGGGAEKLVQGKKPAIRVLSARGTKATQNGGKAGSRPMAAKKNAKAPVVP